MEKKESKQKKDKRPENRGYVVLPYVRGITERIQRVMQKHRIGTPVKPHIKLRQCLVHPKDQVEPDKKCDVVYEIPCLSCNKSYIGETGRAFGIRQKEHRKECEKETAGAHTRQAKEVAEQENLKSAISDHCKRENHLMNWEKSKILQRESNRFQRFMREAVEIRKRAKTTMNRDEGQYMLSHTWDAVLRRPPPCRSP